MKKKLNWKKKWLDDDSGYWHSAKVPVIGWEYIVDNEYDTCKGKGKGYIAGVYLSSADSDISRCNTKTYEKLKDAMLACETHLKMTAKKFNKWIGKK